MYALNAFITHAKTRDYEQQSLFNLFCRCRSVHIMQFFSFVDGMTQCQQEEVIASFRSGRVNLLVSTTVGEEGIDIPDCKYVIRYDVSGNEIASVQSRGRVRDKEGKYEVVAGKETGVIEKENLNVIREEMMEDAIKEVKAMDGDEYKWKVHKQINCQPEIN